MRDMRHRLLLGRERERFRGAEARDWRLGEVSRTQAGFWVGVTSDRGRRPHQMLTTNDNDNIAMEGMMGTILTSRPPPPLAYMGKG